MCVVTFLSDDKDLHLDWVIHPSMSTVSYSYSVSGAVCLARRQCAEPSWITSSSFASEFSAQPGTDREGIISQRDWGIITLPD